MSPLLITTVLATTSTPPTIQLTAVDPEIRVESVWGHPESKFVVLLDHEGRYRTFKPGDLRTDVLGASEESFVGFNFFGDCVLEASYATNRSGRRYPHVSNWFSFGNYEVSLQEVIIRSGARELNVSGVARFPEPVDGITLLPHEGKPVLVAFGQNAGRPTAYTIGRSAKLSTYSLRGFADKSKIFGAVVSKHSGLMYVAVIASKVTIYQGESFKHPFRRVLELEFTPSGTAVDLVSQPPTSLMASTSDGAMFVIVNSKLHQLKEHSSK